MQFQSEVKVSCVWLFATPWTIQSVEFSRTEYWSGLPFPSPGDLPNPGIKPRSPALQADSLPAEPPGKPNSSGVSSLSLLQQIFLPQELNLGLLYCRQILYQLSYQGSPAILKATLSAAQSWRSQQLQQQWCRTTSAPCLQHWVLILMLTGLKFTVILLSETWFSCKALLQAMCWMDVVLGCRLILQWIQVHSVSICSGSQSGRTLATTGTFHINPEKSKHI